LPPRRFSKRVIRAQNDASKRAGMADLILPLTSIAPKLLSLVGK
jgi:hypothetical protein